MTRCVAGLVVAGVLAATLTVEAQQASKPKSVVASVTVTTSDSRHAVAVLSTGEPAFLFCIDLATPLPQKLAYTGPARVVYRPLPADPIPAGIKVDAHEDVASALAVLPSGRKGWLFLGKNEPTVLPAGDDATTLLVRIVRRVDWVAADDGRRRGMDIESCFEVGGN